jgi:eukaryotic-like serine/threonine-protein kinase
MLPAGQKIAHFEVLSQIGAGGMGVVYKARDLQLERVVALKVLPPKRAEDQELRARLLREARAASALNHPNIVTVYEAGTSDGVDYIAMEFVDATLAEKIPAAGMPVKEALAIARAVAVALGEAHSAGVVHRDLKPANVMVRRDGGVKVMDFGLAKALSAPAGEEAETRAMDSAETAAGVVLGTGPYMSPEQAEGKAVDAGSDIFSFGAMFYEMLTGRRAFQGGTLLSVLSAVLRETPAPVHHLRREITPPIEAIVDRCLAKDREARYASGGELAAALDRATATPARMPVRRRRLAILAAAALALLAGIGWWGVRQWRIRWVHNEAIPEISRLSMDQKYLDAYRVAMRAFEILPDDPEIERALGLGAGKKPVKSQPPGARVYWRPYTEPNAAEQFLGVTPGPFRLPLGEVRVRLVKDGFEDTEGTIENSLVAMPTFILDAKGLRPAGMVAAGPARVTIAGEPIDLPAYWIDKFEVTNRASSRRSPTPVVIANRNTGGNHSAKTATTYRGRKR